MELLRTCVEFAAYFVASFMLSLAYLEGLLVVYRLWGTGGWVKIVQLCIYLSFAGAVLCFLWARELICNQAGCSTHWGSEAVLTWLSGVVFGFARAFWPRRHRLRAAGMWLS